MSAQPLPGPQWEAYLDSRAKIIVQGSAIGVPLAATLTGVVWMQYGAYISSGRTDPLWLRWLARMVALVCVGSLVADIMVLDESAVNGLGDKTAFLSQQSNNVWQLVMTVISSLFVQSYFAQVVYRLLANSTIWLGVIALFLLAELGCGIGAAVVLYNMGHPRNGEPCTTKGGWELAIYMSWLGLTTFVDTVSASILCINLWRTRRSSPFRATQDILGRLFTSTLETFTLTAVTSILGLLCSVIPLALGLQNPSIAWDISAGMLSVTLLGRFYPISFFYILHRRSTLHRSRFHPSNSCPPTVSNMPTSTQTQKQEGGPIHVNMLVSRNGDSNSMLEQIAEEKGGVELKDRRRTAVV